MKTNSENEKLERSFRSSETFRVRIPSSTQEKQPSSSSPLPSPISCEEKLAELMEKMNMDETNA